MNECYETRRSKIDGMASPRPECNQYELERQQRIQENLNFMKELGLDKFQHHQPAPKPTNRRRNNAENDAPRRQSGRISGKAPSFEALLPSEDFDLDDSPSKKRQRKSLNHGRSVGSKVYDSVNGTSCHQCRQKTLNPKVKCTKVWEVLNEIGQKSLRYCDLMMDEPCLMGRYGQSLAEALKTGEWVCPKCTGNCNCSFCMKKRGHFAWIFLCA